MLRLLPLIVLFPSVAAADWSPRPHMFDYNSTFDLCMADPSRPDPGPNCANEITTAYVLKRAVARAYDACDSDALATCTTPFEDEGLPAIAVRIATDVGCEAGNVRDLPDHLTFGPDHCITIMSDIMIDEGVVPVFTDIDCNGARSECGGIAGINLRFWVQQVISAAQGDPLIADLQSRNFTDCDMQARGPAARPAFMTASLICAATGSADIWADLARQNEQDN